MFEDLCVGVSDPLLSDDFAVSEVTSFAEIETGFPLDNYNW